MKWIILAVLALSVSGVFAGKVQVSVPGMVCQMCVQGMRKAFKDSVLNPKADVVVDLNKKMLSLNLKNSLSDMEIKQRVKNAGYNAKKITRL